jgi:predicted DNA-binding antitoxin AbrB/MazE fold protein
MTLIDAIYEDGVFKPTGPVNLPERAKVQVHAVEPQPETGDDEDFERNERARKEVLEILSHRYRSGHTDTAERHNEHQP